ncbi:leucine-rich melanocyte differentiation-associated protein-like [Corticium candelabrum]|uniref:leucine-rich melanocyte differentiation-associated protein-like n=1 Tax=Corticium candelabrum TaxID=121492 RepID=UPI002E263104|nr:leucine-rich melanocyte differentiation-associated protein-like [Corticium candelabrum]
MSVKRLSLAYRGLTEVPKEVVASCSVELEELDLGNNRINDLRCLVHFGKMHSLILDRNELTSHTKLPFLPNLHTLWVNHNKISNLSVFVDNVAASCPNLAFLSMMNNEAAPSYFNQGTLEQYTDFRHYVISRLPSLKVLDDTEITVEEREIAIRVYGRHQSTAGAKRKKKIFLSTIRWHHRRFWSQGLMILYYRP